MKKKVIEKIEFLGIPKVSRKKEVKYIGITAIKNVAHERHFFLEVYKNDKASMNIPVVRIVCTKKDFGSYLIKDRDWTKQKASTGHSGEIIWETSEDRRGRGYTDTEKQNILMDTIDLERIKKFFKDIKVWNDNTWWEYITKHQENIVSEQKRRTETRKYESRQKALKERMDETKELPKEMLLELADKDYFNKKHFLYYKKRGNWVDIACTKCGGVADGRWKTGDSYESNFQRRFEEPRAGQNGTCPLCGARGEYKPQGKVKNSYEKSVHVFLGQKYKETGMVFRYVKLSKEWQIELICEEKETKMYNACEKLSGVEIARGYFEEGKSLQIDYHKHDGYTGKDFWDDCNLYGMSNIKIDKGKVISQTYAEMQGTIFQYSGLREYMEAVHTGNPISYLERYKETPQIEMLMKMGLFPVVEELVRYRYGIVRNDKASRLDEFLGIRKDKVKLIIKKGGDLETIKILQTEKRRGQNWTEEQIDKLAELKIDSVKIATAIQIMTIQKMLNRIEKYANCKFGTGYSTPQAKLIHVADIYFDYLSMRQTLGYNLQNTIYQQPRDLEAAHNNMIQECNKVEADKRLREVAERFQDIKKNYRGLRKKYYYKDDNFVIRPARSAEEIVIEGRTLHHCVGGNNYLVKHSTGISTILMLRFKDRESEPYITVEINDGAILQWYGAYDKKPDKENIQKWLEDYCKRLKEDSAENIDTKIAV